MGPSKEDFGHPYQPYNIQSQFMLNLYNCIEDKNIGIFESPTGTGKSLSLICASLTWLRDHKRRGFEDIAAHVEPNGDPDWMIAAEMRQRRQDFLQHRQELEDRLAKIRADDTQWKKKTATDHRGSKKLVSAFRFV